MVVLSYFEIECDYLYWIYFYFQTKKHIVHDFASSKGEIKLLFATEAYGMGADASDVRRILHLGPPNSLESMW